MKFELLLSHWLRVTNIIYAALSSGVLAAGSCLSRIPQDSLSKLAGCN